MYVRTFEADTLDEALKSVKMDLGPDAIILKTVTNKGLKGAFKKKRIEITAAISEENYANKSRVDHVMDDGQKESFYKQNASEIKGQIQNYNGNSYGKMGLNKVVSTVSSTAQKVKDSLDDFLSEPVQSTGDHLNEYNESDFDSFLSGGEDETPQVETRTPQVQARPEPALERQIVDSNIADMVNSQKHQIDLLEEKLFALTQKVNEKASLQEAENTYVREITTILQALGINQKIINAIVKKALFEIDFEQDLTEDELNDFILREMNSMMSIDLPKFSTVDLSDGPVVTALISEVSCGQSSLVTKLAAVQENVKIIRFRQNDHKKHNTSFIKQVFNIDSVTVNTLPSLMSEARKCIEAGESILLDLRLDTSDVDETKKFLTTLSRSFEEIEILVTVSCIHSETYNQKILSKYHALSNGVVVSFLDQCMSFGKLFNLNVEFNDRPLKFYGTGPVIPDDIESATKERILAGMFDL